MRADASGHLEPSDMISTLIPALARAHRKLAGALLRELGLSPGQELLLMLLWESEPRAQSELTRHFAVEPPTTAKMLARLERAGLVKRERLASDRRITLVSLTETGRALEGAVGAVWRELEARTVEALTPQEQDQLSALLGRVTHSLVGGCEE
jgi:DNA-binding MarR family transcriptional regulator